MALIIVSPGLPGIDHLLKDRIFGTVYLVSVIHSSLIHSIMSESSKSSSRSRSRSLSPKSRSRRRYRNRSRSPPSKSAGHRILRADPRLPHRNLSYSPIRPGSIVVLLVKDERTRQSYKSEFKNQGYQIYDCMYPFRSAASIILRQNAGYNRPSRFAQENTDRLAVRLAQASTDVRVAHDQYDYQFQYFKDWYDHRDAQHKHVVIVGLEQIVMDPLNNGVQEIAAFIDFGAEVWAERQIYRGEYRLICDLRDIQDGIRVVRDNIQRDIRDGIRRDIRDSRK